MKAFMILLFTLLQLHTQSFEKEAFTNIPKNPFIIELQEFRDVNDTIQYESSTFIRFEFIHSWGRQDIRLTWSAITWNGSGLDINEINGEDLSTVSRFTPGGSFINGEYIPGMYLSSYRTTDMWNIIHAIPDDTTEVFKINKVHQKSYNEISIPFVIAALNPSHSDTLFIPMSSPYSKKQYMNIVSYKCDTIIHDDHDQSFKVQVFESYSVMNLGSSLTVVKQTSQRKNHYYISQEAPYFLGKTWFRKDDNGVFLIIHDWKFKQFEFLNINHKKHIEAVKNNRKKRLKRER